MVETEELVGDLALFEAGRRLEKLEKKLIDKRGFQHLGKSFRDCCITRKGSNEKVPYAFFQVQHFEGALREFKQLLEEGIPEKARSEYEKYISESFPIRGDFVSWLGLLVEKTLGENKL